MEAQAVDITELLYCRKCHQILSWDEKSVGCNQCGIRFPRINGIPIFIGNDSPLVDELRSEDGLYQLQTFAQETLLSRLASFGAKIVSSEYQPYGQLKNFLSSISETTIGAEFGSGSRRLLKSCVNIDIYPFPNVDIVSDIADTYFRSNSLDYVVLDTVLEHVPNPQNVVDEIFRVLKPGGIVFNISPWIFPYHGYPKNYYNFSVDGLEYLFRNFTNITVETNIGPTAALTNLVSEYFTLAFLGNKKGTPYMVLKGISLMPIFWLKYVDRFWAKDGASRRIASCLCLRAYK